MSVIIGQNVKTDMTFDLYTCQRMIMASKIYVSYKTLIDLLLMYLLYNKILHKSV